MIGIRTTREIEEISRLPIIYGRCGNDYLRKHIERVLNNSSWFDFAGAHRPHNCSDLNRIVTKSRHQNSPACDAKRMA